MTKAKKKVFVYFYVAAPKLIVCCVCQFPGTYSTTFSVLFSKLSLATGKGKIWAQP